MGPRQTEVVHRNEGGEAQQPSQQQPHQQMPMRCQDERSWMQQCMQQSNGDVQNCNYYADLLKQCQAGMGA